MVLAKICMEATLSPFTQRGYLRKYTSFIDRVFLKTEIKANCLEDG